MGIVIITIQIDELYDVTTIIIIAIVLTIRYLMLRTIVLLLNQIYYSLPKCHSI